MYERSQDLTFTCCLIAGLTTQFFQGFQDIQEVACTGAALPSDHNLLSMSLYRTDTEQVYAYANMASRECSTSENFVACDLDKANGKSSVLKALVVDLAEGQSRVYGCNLTSLMSGGRVASTSWSLVVTRPSKSHTACSRLEIFADHPPPPHTHTHTHTHLPSLPRPFFFFFNIC